MVKLKWPLHAVMTIETLDDNSKETYSKSKMETEESRKEVQKLTVDGHQSENISDERVSEAVETAETFTATSQKSGFMITDILSGAATRDSAAATLAAVAATSNSSSPSQSHSSIMAAAAAVVAENDFRARISAAAAALSAAARYNPHSLPLINDNISSTEMIQNSSVSSQLFVHPHAAAAAAAAAAISSGGNTAPITQPSVNDLSGDELSDHDSVSGKGEVGGCFDIGKILVRLE